MTGRRRRWDNFGEPLFGEEWWVADQKLFEDSLIRQQSSPPAPRRRARRTGTIRKRNRAVPAGLVQDMLPGSARSREPPLMNQYGETARRHWERWLPERFAAIENPAAFFPALG